MNDLEEPLRTLLSQTFELDTTSVEHGEVPLIDLLADRIEELLATQMESFMSMMYRLDVPEAKIRSALSPTNDEAPNVTLAKLIIERQVQRIRTKRTFKQRPLDDWMDF